MNSDIVKRIAQVIFTFLLQGSLLFISAGTLCWNWAWFLLATEIIILLINFVVLPGEVIKERGGEKKNVKKWDKILIGFSIIPSLGVYIISGLDYRFSWSPYLKPIIHIISLIILLLASMLFTWSMVSNKFFSTMVRIQKELGHTIAAEGPYKYVRHPGYVGYILMILATPFALGSLYALIASALVMTIFFIRTALEDKTLMTELEGYEEYSRKVKYRLIPFIW
ncbi:MAG: isoprenylcysteine carboxylmethyltransferase family protein [Bacteroidales bacterium]|jgi:protein-S-isoprenylcysteine O-methyltransferase Ste14|nr:isoprenylcysteine carboxylmethyltransferase family protein [Bacteroidales bacterium]